MRAVADERANQSADEAVGVVMYCRPWCGDCARARHWLEEHNIPYTEVDVESDLDARDRAAGHNEGRLHTPTFEIGDGVCVDFRPDRLSELLGIRD
jgi:glutaredoxin